MVSLLFISACGEEEKSARDNIKINRDDKVVNAQQDDLINIIEAPITDGGKLSVTPKSVNKTILNIELTYKGHI